MSGPRRSNPMYSRILRSHVLLIAATFVGAPTLMAQKPTPGGAITISVLDSLGRGIAGAELLVDGAQRGVSDDNGMFRMTAVKTGQLTLQVRRLGFRPATIDAMVDSGSTVSTSVTLSRVIPELTPVFVRGRAEYTGPMAGFYHRRDKGIGHFVTRDQLERQNPAMLTDVFRRIPGVQITSNRTIRNAIRMRGAGARCWPLVWLDGAPLPTAEFDLDVLAPQSLEGIEVYSGPAQVPPQFMGTRGLGSCGAIVVWSRQGTPRRKKKKGTSAAQLAELVASLKVYTADQVDVQARLDSGSFTVPTYPDSLYNARADGAVNVEFVVDTTGQVEVETFGIVFSTHPYFSESVRRAVAEANYIPAVLKGRLVRQVVQQPFFFVAGDSSGGRRGRQRE